MRQLLRFITIASLFLFASSGFAAAYNYTKEDLSGYNLQPDLELAGSAAPESDYSRNGHDIYFEAGYLFTHVFFLNSNVTAYAGSNSLNYTPTSVFQSNYSGFHIGIGKELSRRFDAQLRYLQVFTQSKTTGNQSGSYKFQEVLLDIGLVLNPDSQCQVSLLGGGAFSQYYINISSSGTSYQPQQSLSEVNPAVGAGIAVFMTQSLAFRLSTLYISDLQKVTSNGNINVLAGLSYNV